MRHGRLYRWHITAREQPELSFAILDIRRSYRKLRIAGLSAAETRSTVIGLLLCGAMVNVKAEKLS